MESENNIPLPPPLWSDRAIEDAVYEITVQHRTSARALMLVRSKLTGIRNGYQKILDELFLERREARALLDRAYAAIDLLAGDDVEAQELHSDLREFLFRRLPG